MKIFTSSTFQFSVNSFTRFGTAFMILVVLLFSGEINAQSNANYTFATNATASLTDMSSGTTELSLASAAIPNTVYHDDDATPVTTFSSTTPFVFHFMGVPYTQFSANSNGQVRLGGTVILGTSYTAPTTSGPILAPLTGDNAVQADGKVHYKITGSAPNRIAIIEWTSFRVPFSSTAGTGSSLQLRLYEGTGAVEYVYGIMYNNSTSAVTRSVAWCSSTTATTNTFVSTIAGTPTNNYASTTPWTTTSFTLGSSMTNLNGATNGSRRIFSWTPSVTPTVPTTLTFTSVTGTSMTVNWVDASTNEYNFAVYNSSDGGTTWKYVGNKTTSSTAGTGAANTLAVTGLTAGTSYQWRVYAVGEGKYSTALSGTQGTPLTYTSVANADWNTASTWSPAAVPTAGSIVIVNTNVTAAATPTNQVTSITVNSGFTLTLNGAYTNPSGATITVASGGTLALGETLTNSGTVTVNGTVQINGGGYASTNAFSYAASGTTLIMNHNSGLYGISTGQAFWPTTNPPFNVTIQGTGAQINNTVGSVAGTLTVSSQLNCVATPSVTVTTTGTAILTSQLSSSADGNFLSNGILQINAGGYASGNPPTYGSASSLVYNSGSTSGSPYGVASEWTGSAATAGIGIPNNVTIQGNTFITMSSGNRGAAGFLNVTSGSGITLNASTGDLSIGGNFTQNGTLTNSGRAINFFGTTSTTQTISGTGLNGTSGTNCFAYFLNNSTGSGGVTIGTNVTIDAAVGDVLQLLAAGTLKIGAFTLTVNGNGGTILVSGGTRVIDFTSASGILKIKGTSGTLKTVTSASSGLLSVTSSTAGGQVQVEGGGFDPGSGLTTIQTGAFLTINTGGYVATNSPTYATGSTLSFRTGAGYVVGSGDKTWGIGASGAGVPDKVEVNTASTSVSLTEDRTARTSVTITSGTLTNNTNTLTIATGASAASALVINGGTVANGGGTITIGSAATTTTNALTLSSGSLTNSGGTINVATAGVTAGTAVNITGGTLTNSGGTMNIGVTNGGNQALSLAGGTLALSSGTINLNGNFTRPTAGGTFTQSGGLLSIDGNSGASGTSTGSGVSLFSVISATGTGLNCTAGTIRIVDPPHSSYTTSTTKAVSISYGTTAPSSYQFSGTHTFEFGDGTSTTGGNTDGFVIDTFVGSNRVPLQNVTVNAGAIANRWVTNTYSTSNGTHIQGNLTINASSEFRNTTTAQFVVNGNIANAGTLTSTQTITLASIPVAGTAPVAATTAQTINGSGTYKNLISSPTAKFTSIVFNNSTAGAAVTLGIGDVNLTGTATFTAGIVDIGNNNSFNFVGTASAVARTSGYALIQGTGQMKKDFATGTSSFTFHVGENTGTTEYSPYSLSFTANSLARTIGVRPVDATHPSIDDVDVQTDYISRYWQLSNSAAGTYTYTATATYLPADINGTEGNMKMNLWTGASPWSQLASTAASNVLTISSGVTEVSAPLGATAEFTGRVKGSTTYTWDGSTDSVWSTATNWTPDRNSPAANDILVFDGASTPSPTVTGFASQTISKLLLTNSVNLNLQPTATATLTIAGGTGTDLDIPSGSTLNLSGGASVGLAFTGTTTSSIAGTLTYSSTAGIPTLDFTNTIATVTGTINLSSTTNATITSSGTSLLMNSGSFMNLTNGTTIIPLATWDTNSTIVFSGSGTSFTNVAQSFGNFTYNSSVNASTVSFFTSNTVTIKGNLNIQATGSGKFRATTSGAVTVQGNLVVSNAASFDVTGGAGTVTVNGDFTHSSSGTTYVTFSASSTGVLSVLGSFSQSAGIIDLGNTTTASGTLKVGGTFNQSAGTLQYSGTATTSLLEFNGSSSQSVTIAGSINNLINYKVSNASGIAITGTLPVNAGATFTAASSGTAVTSGTVSYSTTTTLAYVTAVGTQTTGNEFPSTSGPVNLTINNTNGTPNVSLSASRTVTGLTITAGRILLGNNDLTSTGTLTISTPGTAKMIVINGSGVYKRSIATGAATYLFPIGESTGTLQYSPITLQFTANSVTRIVGAKVIDDVSTNMNTPSTPTNYLSRYWTFTENGAGGTYNYYINPAVAVTGSEDENGTASLIKAAYWNGSAWTLSANTYTSGSLVSAVAGVSETAAPLGSVEWTGRDTPPVTYTWVGFTDGSWNTAANWSPSGVPGSSDTVTLTNGSTGAAANLNLTTAVSVSSITFDGTGNFFTVGASPAAITVLGNVTYTGGTGTWNATSTFTISSASSQTIPAFSYGNLNGTGGARVWSTGTTGIAGTFTSGAGAYTATSGSTVNFNGTGSQTIGAVNYENLTISGARGTATITLASGTIDVSGLYTVSATGTITVAPTGNTVNFSSGLAQTIPAFGYNNITNTGNGPRTLASSGTIGIAGTTFTPGTGAYTVTGSTVNFSNATGLTIPALSPAATNNYNNLTISGAGAFLQGASLILGGNYSQTAGTYTVTSGASALTLTVGGTFTQSAGTFNVTGASATAGATVTVAGATSIFSILMSPNTAGNSSVITFQVNNNVTFTGTSTSTAFDWSGSPSGTQGTTYPITFGITGNFSWTGTGSPDTSGYSSVLGFTFNGAGTVASPQTLSYAGASSTYGLSFVVSSGTVVKLLNNLALGTSANPPVRFTVNGTLDAQGFVISGGSTSTQADNTGFTLASGATLRTSNTGGITSTITNVKTNYNAAANYEFYGTAAIAANFPNTTMNNLTNSSTNTTTQGATITVNGNLGLTSGTWASGTNPIALAGNITGTGTHTSSGAGILTMSGASKTISGATLGNLTLNNAAGFSLTGSPTVNGNFTFTNGNLDLNGSNNVTLGSTTAITGETCSKQFINTGSPSQGNGFVQTTRTFASGTNYLGIAITSATALGSTNIKRFVQKTVTTPSGINTIKRVYSVTPTSAASGNVTLTSSYCDGELNGNTESSPALITYYSTGADETIGYSNVYAIGSNDAAANTVTTGTTGSLIAGQNNITLANAGPDAYYTVQDGNWDTNATWALGAVPPTTADVTVKHIVAVAADATANSLEIESGKSVTVASGFDLTITDSIINNGGTLTIENNANLMQSPTATTNTNSGNVIVKRNSSLLKRLDYTLWSSPVTGQGLYAFSKFTLPNRFYVYDEANDNYNNSMVGFSLTGLQYPAGSGLISPNGVNGTDTANVQFENGKGYLIRVPYNHPTSPTVYNGIFTGVANNGDISTSVSTTLNGYNAVGNPYPSRLNIWDFIDGNANITGPLYFWRKTNTTATSTSYATLTKTAYVANGSAGGDTGTGFFPTGGGQEADWVINVGQGFIVKVTSGSTISFTNSMRRSSNANQFFKNNETVNDVNNGLYWLNLTDNTGVYSQMAVGYSAVGTIGFDRGIDGENINREFYLTSLIDAGEYSVQGRPEFDSADIVPLSYKALTSGNYTIAIDHTAGLFTDVSQPIYVKDNVTSTYHDLNTGAYSFVTQAGTFNDRFEIVYALPLGIDNPTFTANNVIVYNQNNELIINSGNTIMSSVKIFDIRGRLIQERNGINASQTSMNAGLANEVLLVQITSDDGTIVTKKVIR